MEERTRGGDPSFLSARLRTEAEDFIMACLPLRRTDPHHHHRLGILFYPHHHRLPLVTLSYPRRHHHHHRLPLSNTMLTACHHQEPTIFLIIIITTTIRTTIVDVTTTIVDIRVSGLAVAGSVMKEKRTVRAPSLRLLDSATTPGPGTQTRTRRKGRLVLRNRLQVPRLQKERLRFLLVVVVVVGVGVPLKQNLPLQGPPHKIKMPSTQRQVSRQLGRLVGRGRKLKTAHRSLTPVLLAGGRRN